MEGWQARREGGREDGQAGYCMRNVSLMTTQLDLSGGGLSYSSTLIHDHTFEFKCRSYIRRLGMYHLEGHNLPRPPLVREAVLRPHGSKSFNGTQPLRRSRNMGDNVGGTREQRGGKGEKTEAERDREEGRDAKASRGM